MIALTDAIRKGSLGAYFRAERGESSDSSRHGIVSGITIQPLFRQPPAALDCETSALRWPGSFGFGFLSPQPPGIVGTGPSAANKGQRELALLFLRIRTSPPRHSGARASPESTTTIVSMDSGPAPNGASRNDDRKFCQGSVQRRVGRAQHGA